MGLVDRALAHPGRDDRGAKALGQPCHRLARLGGDGAAAGHDDGSLRRCEETSRPFHFRGRGSWRAPRLPLFRIRQDDVGRLGLNVHRHVQEDRPGPPGNHLVPRAMHDEWDVVDARRPEPLLDDGIEDPRVVGAVPSLDFLEQSVAAHVRVRGAGHQEHRGRVDVGGPHADNRVGLAGTDAREGQHRPARDAVVAVRQMHGRLLVHHLDGADLVRPVEERVGEVPAAVAGDARRVRHALADQVLDDDLSARQPHGRGLVVTHRRLYPVVRWHVSRLTRGSSLARSRVAQERLPERGGALRGLIPGAARRSHAIDYRGIMEASLRAVKAVLQSITRPLSPAPGWPRGAERRPPWG